MNIRTESPAGTTGRYEFDFACRPVSVSIPKRHNLPFGEQRLPSSAPQIINSLKSANLIL